MKIKYIEFESELGEASALSPGKRLDLIDDINEMLEKQEENAMSYEQLLEEVKRLEDVAAKEEETIEKVNALEVRFGWDLDAIKDILEAVEAHGIVDSIDLDCRLAR